MLSQIEARSGDVGVSFAVPDLEEILRKAPKEVVYEPNNNGFKLVNEVVRIGYTDIFFGGSDGVELDFLKTYPEIRLDAHHVGGYPCVDMERLPSSLVCEMIRAQTSDKDRVEVYSRPSHWASDLLIGSPEWFDRASGIMRQAAVKYDLKHWYHVYRGKEGMVESPIPRPSLSSRIRRLLPS
ncbi:MAG: hypothetical protein ABIH63_03590 [archaeon]